eukprot:355608-Pleurochrysis_carterae.AAC.1
MDARHFHFDRIQSQAHRKTYVRKYDSVSSRASPLLQLEREVEHEVFPLTPPLSHRRHVPVEAVDHRRTIHNALRIA